jgi:hypothetical protein
VVVVTVRFLRNFAEPDDETMVVEVAGADHAPDALRDAMVCVAT